MQYSPAPEGSLEANNTEKPDLHAGEDGRNREWEDRARVNLETVPEGTHTNVERNFEPEQDPDAGKNRNEPPAY